MKYTQKIIIVLILFNILFANNLSSANEMLPQNNLQNNMTINSVDSEHSSSIEDPIVYAESAILLDYNEDKILFEKNAKKVMYPASITKLLTAILVVENCNDLTQKVNISYYSVNEVPATYSTASLIPQEKITVNDLLKALLIQSANDAAFSLAEFVANKGNNYPLDNSENSKKTFEKSMQVFSDLMNSRAKELGCLNTHFINPNGIHNKNHYTTAYDMMLIGKKAYSNSTIKSICGMTEFSLPSSNMYNGEVRSFNTTNPLIRKDKKGYYEYADGLKTGFTDAAQSCIVASAKKDNRNLIVVILNSNSENEDENATRESDCKRLFEYGFNNFSIIALKKENEFIQGLKIINGSKETKELNAVCKNNIEIFIKNDDNYDATPQIDITKSFAPISKGEVIGKITYNINGKVLTSDLIAEHDVYPIDYTMHIIILLVVFIIAFILLITTNTGHKRKRNYKSKRKRF